MSLDRREVVAALAGAVAGVAVVGVTAVAAYELLGREKEREVPMSLSVDLTPVRKGSLAVDDHDDFSQHVLDNIGKDMALPILVGVGGASGSGKTTIATLLHGALPPGITVASMSSDSYYKPLGHAVDASTYNFDHPDAIDVELLVEQLSALKAHRSIDIPDYDFTTHQRVGTHRLDPADIIILDGIFILAVERVRKSCDLTIFTMEDSDVCLARRLRRDISERGRTLESVLVQYERFVKPGFQTFIQPTMSKADLIIPRARDNHRAIHMLARDLATQVFKYKRKLAGMPTPARSSDDLPSEAELASLLSSATTVAAPTRALGAAGGAHAPVSTPPRK